MPRKLKPEKPLIYVFYEGESEQAYAKFLKLEFEDVAVIKYPPSTGLFEEADALFKKNKKYRDSAEQTDEIWFFFDVETKDIAKWEQRLKIIKKLRKLRKKPNIRVRLLMTTGCVEYWFMLHYKKYAPPIQTVAEKERVIDDLVKKVPNYYKGDLISTFKIAEYYPNAIINAKQILNELTDKGLPEVEDTDERNHWLYTKCETFSTVYEAIEYLENII